MVPRPGRSAPAALAAVLCALIPLACGSDTEPTTAGDPEPAPLTTTGQPAEETTTDPETEPEGEPAERAPSARRLALDAVRAYARALSRRDGERVCELLTPEAFAMLEPPRERGDCAATLAASIGYEDPRGLPVFESARYLRGDETVVVDGATARVTATAVTDFADRELPSVEDDVVHLRREGGRWRLVKPSTLLYRAIGVAEIPPEALAPPK